MHGIVHEMNIRTHKASAFSIVAVTEQERVSNARRILDIMKNFQCTRTRLRLRRASTKNAIGDTPTRQIYKYMNKITKLNYGVISHGILRLLVESSTIKSGDVFKDILQYSAECGGHDYGLCARLCHDLRKYSTDFPAIVERMPSTGYKEPYWIPCEIALDGTQTANATAGLTQFVPCRMLIHTFLFFQNQ